MDWSILTLKRIGNSGNGRPGISWSRPEQPRPIQVEILEKNQCASNLGWHHPPPLVSHYPRRGRSSYLHHQRTKFIALSRGHSSTPNHVPVRLVPRRGFLEEAQPPVCNHLAPEHIWGATISLIHESTVTFLFPPKGRTEFRARKPRPLYSIFISTNIKFEWHLPSLIVQNTLRWMGYNTVRWGAVAGCDDAEVVE